MKNLIALLIFLTAGRLLAQTFPIGHTTITYTDPARSGRAIATEIYYPATTAGTGVPSATGSFPLLIFGHGFVMGWDSYQNFWDNLVPQGYIIAFPKTEGSFSPSHAEFGKDLKFLVTKIQSEGSTNSSFILYNHVNARSAIMGHSMGGGSSFLAAESNLAITTMVSFAAANTSPSAITAAQNVGVPALVFSGENDCVAPASDHQTKMYDSLSSPCKAFVSIKGGAHCEFANYNFNCAFGESTCTPTPTITRTEQQDVVADLLILWLDYYLKDDCAAWDHFNDSLSGSMRINGMSNCTISDPVITQSGTLLTSTPATTYQWYLNGNPLPGETSQSTVAAIPGNYQVQVGYFNTCPYLSNVIAVLSTSILDEQVAEFFTVYPTPASGELFVKLHGVYGKTVINVQDLQGRNLLVKEVLLDGSEQILSLDLAFVTQGNYLISIESGGKKRVRKMLKL